VEKEKLHLLQVRKRHKTSRASTQKEGVEEVVYVFVYIVNCIFRIFMFYMMQLISHCARETLKGDDDPLTRTLMWILIISSYFVQIVTIVQGVGIK
jgi:hypothetical protein